MTEANITIEDAQSTDPNKVVKVVHISGQLDESNIDEKIKDIYKVVEATPKGLTLILDLENLEYMNSKSIGYITDIYGKITEGGGKVAIAKPKPNITDILQVVGLTQLIQSFDTVDAAKAALVGGTTPKAEAPAAPAPEPEKPAEPKPETPAPTPPAPEPPKEPATPPTETPMPEAPKPAEPAPEPEAPKPAEPTPEPPAPATPPTTPPAETPKPEAPATPETPPKPTSGEEGTYKFDQ
jgi:anti-anti-sigma factor